MAFRGLWIGLCFYSSGLGEVGNILAVLGTWDQALTAQHIQQ